MVTGSFTSYPSVSKVYFYVYYKFINYEFESKCRLINLKAGGSWARFWCWSRINDLVAGLWALLVAGLMKLFCWGVASSVLDLYLAKSWIRFPGDGWNLGMTRLEVAFWGYNLARISEQFFYLGVGRPNYWSFGFFRDGGCFSGKNHENLIFPRRNGRHLEIILI